MNIAETIAKMRAAGFTAEAIVAALECVVVEAPVIERSGAARRQAAYRLREKERNALRNVDNEVTVKKSFDKESFQTFKEITSKKLNTTRARKTELPDDWEPDAKSWQLSETLGFEAQDVWDQISRMRDWAKNADGSKGRKSDWDAAFRNWIKRAADDRREKRPQGPIRTNTIADSAAKASAVIDEYCRRVEASSAGQDSGVVDIGTLPGFRKMSA